MKPFLTMGMVLRSLLATIVTRIALLFLLKDNHVFTVSSFHFPRSISKISTVSLPEEMIPPMRNNIASYPDPRRSRNTNRLWMTASDEDKPKRYEDMSITELLNEVQKQDIRISPTASRQDLIRMLAEKSNEEKKRMDASNRKSSPSFDAERIQERKLGDESYGKTKRARRRQQSTQEEEIYLRKSRKPQKSRNKRQRRRQRNQSNDSILDDAFQEIIPTARKAQSWSVKAADRLGKVVQSRADELGDRISRIKESSWETEDDVDEDGVREADWYYVSKEKVETVTSDSSKNNGKARQSMQNDELDKKYSKRARRRPRRPGRVSRNNESIDIEKEVQRISDLDDTSNRNSLLLPPRLEGVQYFPNLQEPSSNDQVSKQIEFPVEPINEEKDKIDDSPETLPKSKRRNRDRSRTTKKAYTVYPSEDESSDLQELYGQAAAGAIDSLGEFLADVAGGDFDAYNKTIDTNRNERDPKRRKRRVVKRRYWKDKLAERVDYALGVYEDGKYYKSWEEQMEKERQRESKGTDPISIFYGNQKKNRNVRKREGPFWEQDGNLMALLFGRDSHGKKVRFDVSMRS